MKKPIYERIISEAEAEANAILREAELSAKALISKGKELFVEEKRQELVEGEANSKARVKNYQEREEKSLINFQEQTRQQLVVDVFSEVREKLASLEGKELLNFVVSLIKKENVSGEEIFHVSKRNIEKYTKALGKKLEHLNSVDAHYNFTISAEPTYIEEGFLLAGKAFDLVFDFTEIVDQYQKENEQRIYNELFKNE